MIKNYRPEIDGLRALCILSVLFYHAELSVFGHAVFKGGYVGVDVFFIVSGYLISSHILSDLAQNRFSFRKFYERRARRILPALYIMLLSTIPCAWIFMFPDTLKKYAGSLLSTVLSLSNFYFWREDSYAAEPSAYKPLLHSWSLSVEEQFYLLFPLLLYLLRNQTRRTQILTITAISLASLGLAQWASTNWINGNFFLLPTRLWELGFGALLAAIGVRKIEESVAQLHRFLPSLGLLLILYSVRTFSHKTAHPSILTGIPVLGAALILSFGGRGDITSRILSSKVLVGIGLISYSLYIWHQPLFAFARLASFQPLGSIEKVLLIVCSFVCAYLSWKFIETPFRNPLRVRPRIFWTALTSLTLLFLILGSTLWLKEGVPSRLNAFASEVWEDQRQPEYGRLKQDDRSCRSREISDLCRFGNESWVSLGDSHVAVFDPSLQRILAKKDQGLITMNYDQCPFVPGLWFGAISNCADINRKRWQEIERWTTKKTIVIAADAEQFSSAKVEGKNESVSIEKVADGFRSNVQKLLSLGHRVILIYPVPHTGIEVNGALAYHTMHQSSDAFSEVFAADDDQLQKTEALYFVFDQVPNDARLLRYYPSAILCPSSSDGRKRCIAISKDGPYYNVASHLSRIGAEKVLNDLMGKTPLNF